MFDLLFDALSAWSQLGLFLMAFVFLLIGGGMISYEIFWHLKAKVIQGRVIGVREKKGSKNGPHYYGVLEFKAPDGSRREQISGFGSSSILNRIPGQYVKLMMMPDNPDKVRRPTVVLMFFGLVFVLPGLLVLNTAVQTFEPNFMMIVLPIGFIGFLAVKIWMSIQRVPEEERQQKMKEFKSKRTKGFSFSESNKSKGRLLETSEITEIVKKHVKQAKLFGYVMLVVSLGLGGGAYYLGLDMKERLETGLRASGEIVGREYKRSSGDSQGTYSAVVRFVDQNGKRHKFTEKHGSSHPTFRKGDAVEVIYNADDPKDAIVDHGLWNWLLSGGLGLAAALILWGAFYNLSLVRKHGGVRARGRV